MNEAILDHGLLVGGVWAAASDGALTSIIDPSSGATVARCARATRRDVRRALSAAAACVEDGRWAALPLADRIRAIANALDLEDPEDVAEIIARETGTPIWTARLEARTALDGARWLLEASASGSDTVPADLGDAYTVATRAPAGVVVVIGASITPLRDVLWRAVPALASGNAVVVTTSAESPCAVLRVCGRIASALPRDALHVVAPGSTVVWDELAGSPYTALVAATGSRDLLRRIAERAAVNLVPTALRADEPSAALLLDDADIATASAALLRGMARHAGQSHHACARVAVPVDLADPLLDALAAGAAMLRTGPLLEDGTQMGPVLSTEVLARTARSIDRARAAGAGVRAGGHALVEDGLEGGSYHAPTILAGDVPDPVGPVISVVTSDDIPVRAARVAIFTADAQRALPYAQRPGVTALWVNGHPEEDARIATTGRAGSGGGAAFGEEGARAYAVPVSIRLR